MSVQESKKLSPEAARELDRLRGAGVAQDWTREELDHLSLLCQDSSWQVLLRYLGKLQASLTGRLLGSDAVSLEQLNYMRGQMRVVELLNRLPQEIRMMKETLAKDEEQPNGSR